MQNQFSNGSGVNRRISASVFILLALLIPTLGLFISIPVASATTVPAWNPNVNCQAVLTSDHGVIGNHFNTTTNGALESGGPFGVFATNQNQIGSTSDLQPSLNPPCTYPNVNGTMAPTFVEIHGISLTSGTSVESGTAGGKCGTHYQGTNGFGSYPGGKTFCTSYGVFQDTSEYTGNCEIQSPPIPKICIRLEIDRDWFAAGFCGTGTVCDSTTFNQLTIGQKIDVQGFVAWHPPSSAGHGYSSWEIHPVTAWRFTPTQSSPPVVTVQNPTPNPASTGSPVNLAFTVSSATTVTGITVNWGDGSVLDSLSGTATSDSHIYTSTGNAKSQTFTITVRATNSAGQGSGSTSETVNDRAPFLTINSLTPNPATPGSPVTISFSSNDPDGTVTSFSVNWGDGSAPDNLPGTATSDAHTYSSAGSFPITLTAADNSGSTGTVTGSETVQNPQAPTVTINSLTPNPASTGTLVTLTFTATGSKITSLTVNWGDYSTIDSLPSTATSDTHTYSSTGTTTTQAYTVTVTATNSGGAGSRTASETVNDRAPTVTINSISPSSAQTGSTVTVNFGSTDPDGSVSSFTINWGDGSAPTNLSGTASSASHVFANTGNSQSQSFLIVVTATDNSGSTGSSSGTVTVNDRPPMLSVTSVSPNPANTGQTVTLSFSGSDPDGSVSSIIISWGDGSAAASFAGTATSATHIYSSTGSNSSESFVIQLTATDNSGSSVTTTATVIVNDTAPVVSVNGVSPNPALVGQTVNVTFSASDADGSISSISVNWGDGSPLDNLPGTSTSDTHSYLSTGTFTITLTALDNSGSSGSANASETVTSPLAPSVNVNGPSPNPASTMNTVTVSFTVSSSLPVTSVTVNWGDGSPVDNLPVNATSDTHIYTSTGNTVSQSFTITVTATNSAGTGFQSTSETVNDQIPRVTIGNVTPNPVVTGSTVTLSFNSTDIDGSVTGIAVNWGDGSPVDNLPGTATVDTHVYASTGSLTSKSFTIIITATDNSGSTGTASASGTVNDRAPSVSLTGLSPNPANAGQLVTVTFSANDVDGSISSIIVNWGDGSPVHNLAGTVGSDAHAYSSAGNFTITITAIDNSGSTGQVSARETVLVPTAAPYSLVATVSGQVYKLYQNGTLILIGQPVTTPLRQVSWKPDGSYALIVGDSAVLLKYDGTSLTTISTPISSGYNFWSVAWKQNGSYALIGGSVGILLKYDGVSVIQINPGGATILSISWNPSGAYAVLAGKSGSLRTYDGTVVKSFATGTTNDLQTVAWNPNGQYALIGGLNGIVLSFDGTTVTTLSTTGLTGTNGIKAISFNPAGTIALLVGDNGMVLTYNGSTLSLLPSITSSWLYSISWAPNGTAYIVGGSGTVLTYTNGTLAKLTTSPTTTLQFRVIAWKP